MEKEVFIVKKGKWTKASKWDLFWRTISHYFNRYKIVDTWKYKLILHDDSKYYFKLSPKEYEEAEKLYKEKGTLSYEFYPCGGIGWGVRVKVVDTDEIIDITDVSSW